MSVDCTGHFHAVFHQVFAFFADHRVSQRPSRRRQLMSYRRQDEPQPGPWQVRLAVHDLQPSKRLPPPMNVPVDRTRRFRCTFDLRRCRRRLVPSSVTYSSGADSRGPSRLLEDIDQQTDHTAVDQAATDTGPLIVVKHFCKVYLTPDLPVCIRSLSPVSTTRVDGPS